MVTSSGSSTEAQLLWKSYESAATNKRREYFLYLPEGYGQDKDRLWPVILFLHGGGERGDGLEDLDWVLWHGPLAEAWIQRRNLPFIMIGPQLPVFGMHDQVRLREGRPRPERLAEGSPPRADENRPDQPKERSMVRAPDETPAPLGVTEEWGKAGAPGGWQLCEQDLLSMVDTTLREYNADPERVYLTGLSYGGYGTWYLATAHPNRWAAIAPICGGGNSELAHKLAEVQMPIWIFHGGRDLVVKPQWIYGMANALEQAGCSEIRLTIHEDRGHNSFTRVYAGEDLYQWFLAHQRK
jgi:predicted peptidase